MCGILGYFFKQNYAFDHLQLITNLDTLSRRGPDHKNYKLEKINNNNIFLGHTRLSILELSDLGINPFMIIIIY